MVNSDTPSADIPRCTTCGVAGVEVALNGRKVSIHLPTCPSVRRPVRFVLDGYPVPANATLTMPPRGVL